MQDSWSVIKLIKYLIYVNYDMMQHYQKKDLIIIYMEFTMNQERQTNKC